jgi:hypothetical protein
LIIIALSLLRCKTIIATELESILDNLKYNIDKNIKDTGNIVVQRLKWNDKADLGDLHYVPDIVICSDCLYNEASWEDLLETLLYFTRINKSLTVIFAYKKRYQSQELFVNSFLEYFDVEYIPKVKFYHEFQVTDDYEIMISRLKVKK